MIPVERTIRCVCLLYIISGSNSFHSNNYFRPTFQYKYTKCIKHSRLYSNGPGNEDISKTYKIASEEDTEWYNQFVENMLNDRRTTDTVEGADSAKQPPKTRPRETNGIARTAATAEQFADIMETMDEYMPEEWDDLRRSSADDELMTVGRRRRDYRKEGGGDFLVDNDGGRPVSRDEKVFFGKDRSRRQNRSDGEWTDEDSDGDDVFDEDDIASPAYRRQRRPNNNISYDRSTKTTNKSSPRRNERDRFRDDDEKAQSGFVERLPRRSQKKQRRPPLPTKEVNFDEIDALADAPPTRRRPIRRRQEGDFETADEDVDDDAGASIGRDRLSPGGGRRGEAVDRITKTDDFPVRRFPNDVTTTTTAATAARREEEILENNDALPKRDADDDDVSSGFDSDGARRPRRQKDLYYDDDTDDDSLYRLGTTTPPPPPRRRQAARQSRSQRDLTTTSNDVNERTRKDSRGDNNPPPPLSIDDDDDERDVGVPRRRQPRDVPPLSGRRRRRRQRTSSKRLPVKDPDRVWMNYDDFRDNLRREAQLRLTVLGPKYKSWVKAESEWRLELYRKWLLLLEDGVDGVDGEERRRYEYEQLKRARRRRQLREEEEGFMRPPRQSRDSRDRSRRKIDSDDDLYY